MNDGIDDFCQFFGRFNRLNSAAFCNAGRNLPRFALLAVFVNQIGQFFFRHFVDKVGGSAPVQDILMSKGASLAKENPLSASSSCMEDTPMSKTAPLTG